MATSDRRLEALEREVRRLRQELAQRIVKPPKGSSAAHVYTLSVDSGNTLSDGSTLGVKYVSSTIASVPSAYDPNVTSAFIDGIGRGTLYVDGLAQAGYVLIVHDARGGSITDALFQGDLVLSSRTTAAIAVAGDPNGATVACYLALTP